jgi:hypothetical protein
VAEYGGEMGRSATKTNGEQLETAEMRNLRNLAGYYTFGQKIAY